MIIRKGPPLPLCSHLYHIGYKLLWRFWHVFPLLDYESSRTRESVIFISCEYKYIHASYSIYFSCVFMSYLFQERFNVLLGFCWENLLLPVFTISVTSNHSSNCSIQKRRSHSSLSPSSWFSPASNPVSSLFTINLISSLPTTSPLLPTLDYRSSFPVVLPASSSAPCSSSFTDLPNQPFKP